MPSDSPIPRSGRPGGARSLAAATSWESGGGPGGSRRVAGFGAPFRRVEIQSDPPNHEFGEYQEAYQTVGGGGRPEFEEPSPATDEADPADWQLGCLLLRDMPGYRGLPVMQPQKAMNPYGRTVVTGRLPATAAAGAPFFRTGRNGSNWRHVTQCTGNLGNHIVFINGRSMKSDDCDEFSGFPAAGHQVSLPRQPPTVSPGVLPVRRAAGVGGSGAAGLYNSRALQRARAGNKYWFEDKRPSTLTPTTIQGRIMRSGVAY